MVRHLVDRNGCSERRACELIGTSRSSVRYESKPRPEREKLREQVRMHAGRHKRYGYRRVWGKLRNAGERVNVKTVHRIWKEERLGLPRKRPKRSRQAKGVEVRRPEYRNHVWSLDLMEDRTERGGRLKFLCIVDDFTRECLAIRVERSMGSRVVMETLGWLFQERGAPTFVRSDNGPEFIAKALQEMLSRHGAQPIYITPGSPWENGYIESFNGKFRDECLNREIFRNGKEAQEVSSLWMREYNEERPHSSLGYRTPAEFARDCDRSGRPTASLRDHNPPDQQPGFLSL